MPRNRKSVAGAAADCFHALRRGEGTYAMQVREAG